MMPLEIIRKIRSHGYSSSGEWVVFDLTESEAAALLTDEPSKTAEELYNQLDGIRAEYGYDQYSNPVSTRTREIEAIQSALTAHAKAAVEEAADRYCSLCPGDGVEDCNRSTCADRAAILGREVER